MSKSYYENGANHYDHHKELHIDTVNGGDIGNLISAFFKDDAEEADFEEINEDTLQPAPVNAEEYQPASLRSETKRGFTSFIQRLMMMRLGVFTMP